MEKITRANVTAETGEQYSLVKILGIWALAALPMAVLSWVIFPALSPDADSDPLGATITRFALIIAGLIWQFVLAMIIMRREEGNLRWTTVKRRLRLNTPRDPKSGQPRRRLWLWVIPAVVGVAVVEIFLASTIENLWVSIFPFFSEPPGYSFAAVLERQEILDRLVGAWWFFGLFLLSTVFNSFLGEELLFRGVLLPKMGGVFGRWSWVANSVLFGFYHLHQPWGILAIIISDALFFAFPAWRFRSTWMSIIVHSAQGVYFGFLILGIILGLA